MNKMKKIFVTILVLVVFLVVSACALIWSSESNKDYGYEVYHSRVELAMEGVHDRIVTEIDRYIDSVAPNSALNGITLFQMCEKYDVDVVFAMAQAELESHFGVAGVASKTNSVWNVKAYDGRSAADMNRKGDGFSHPDHSIEPYLQLLVNDYMVNGKTEEDMFVKFVNKTGNRYASSTTYETKLLSIYNKINEKTCIRTLLDEYKKYRMILGY